MTKFYEFKYEIEIYFGKTLDENGMVNETNNDDILVSMPTEYRDENPKYMHPNIARLKKVVRKDFGKNPIIGEDLMTINI